MTFKNMKFKVDSPEQSERVINILQRMGYVLYNNRDMHDFVDDPVIFSYENGDIASGEDYGSMQEHKLQDATAFLAAHEPAPAPTVVNYPDGHWFDNTGTMPDLPKGTLIDVVFCDGTKNTVGLDYSRWWWGNQDKDHSNLAQWRYHQPEDAASYFVQPKTEPKPVKSDGSATTYYDLVIRTKAGTFNCKVGDVIDAMVGNDFDLGNALKAIRRIYEHVQGRGKDGVDAEYDKNKVNYFVNEFIERSKLK